MINSMTGFGRSELKGRLGAVFCEMRSVNHRYLEISMRLPDGCGALEAKVRERIQKRVRRGRVDIIVAVDGATFGSEGVEINKALAKRYVEAIKGLKRDFGIGGALEIRDLISLPDILRHKAAPSNSFKLWPIIEKAVDAAADELCESRLKEGRELFKDISARARRIDASLSRIKARSPAAVERYRKTLSKELAGASTGSSIDMERIEKEVAIFARSCDISEEVTRMRAHLKSFTGAMAKDGAEIGKRLDFISQELHREANTICSKANDAKIQGGAIEIKSQIEKIREQLQNVE